MPLEIGGPSKAELSARYVAPVNVLAHGAKGDGVADDTAAIAAAITAATAGKRQVYLPGGTYKVTGTLTIPSGVEVLGEGSKGTIIQTTTDLTVFKTVGGEGQAIRRLKIANSFQGTRTTHDIVMVNPYHPTIEAVEIALSQLSLQKGGVHIYHDTAQADPSQKNMPTLRDVWIRNGVLRIIDVGDVKIFGGWTWGTYTGAAGAVELDRASNIIIVNHDVIPSVNAGYIITGGLSNATMIGGLMDGNGDPAIHPGTAIKVAPTGYIRSLQIVGVKFWELWHSGLDLYDARAVTITGCSFRANNREDNAHPEIKLTACRDIVATGNTFSAVVSRVNKGLVWSEDAASSDNLIANNVIERDSFYASGVYSTQPSTVLQGNMPIATWPRTDLLAKAADYTVTKDDMLAPGKRTILTTAAATITLPSSTSVHAGSPVTIKAGAATTVATTSGQTIDGSALARNLLAGESLTLITDGGNWRTVGTQSGPRLVVPQLSVMALLGAAAWGGANLAVFSRFTLNQPTSLRYANIRIDTSSGNWQIAVVALSGASAGTYTRVMDTGVVAMPTAGDKRVDLGQTTLPAGDYAIVVWCDNVTAQLRVATNSAVPVTHLSAEVAGLTTGLPASGTGLVWNSNRMLGSLTIEPA